MSSKRGNTSTKEIALPPNDDSTSIPNGHCHLLDLPPELRLYIYDTVFESLATSATYQELEYHTALLYTNKQIFSEAIPFVRKHQNESTRRAREELSRAYRMRPAAVSEGDNGTWGLPAPWTEETSRRERTLNKRLAVLPGWGLEFELD